MTNSMSVNERLIMTRNAFSSCNRTDSGLDSMKFITLVAVTVYRYSATLLDSSSYALTKFTGSKLNNFVIVKLSLGDTARVYVLFILLYPCFVLFSQNVSQACLLIA